LDTLHPIFHLDLKFRAEKELGQAHDSDDSTPFKLKMSQLGTTLTSWSNEMQLSEKKAPRVLHISQDASNDDESYGDPDIFALYDDMKCSLCGRTGHEDTSCHKFMNHVIGDALMKSHVKEAKRINRENKQFVTVGPRGTPRNGLERTNRRPPSVIRMIAAPHPLPLDVTPIADAPIADTLEMSFDKTVQISRVGLDDSGSVTSEESDGPFDYGSSAHIAEPHDISMGVRYDDALIDRINAN
jgi:hypothetical protein